MDDHRSPAIEACRCDRPADHHRGLSSADRDGLRRRLASAQRDLEERGREAHERAAGRMLAAAWAVLEQFVEPARGLVREAWQEIGEPEDPTGHSSPGRTGSTAPEVIFPLGPDLDVHPEVDRQPR